MQVNLTIDAAQLGETVVDVFKSLSSEQRQEIAVAVLREWLMQPNDAEFIKDDIFAMQAARSLSYYLRDKADAEVRKSEEYRKAIARSTNPKTQMIRFVRDEAVSQFQASVKEMVASDPQIQKMRDAVCEVVRENFPRVVHDAMVLWVAANLDKAVSAAVNGVCFSQQGNYDGSGTVQVPVLRAEMGKKIMEVLEKKGLSV